LKIKNKFVSILLLTDALINIYTLIRPSTKHIRFGDLSSNLVSAECYSRISINVYKNSSEVGYCGEYLYGRYYLNFLNIFNFQPSQRIFIGTLNLILIITISIWLIKMNKQTINNVGILPIIIFLAPGNILLIERANLDITIIILLVAASYLLYKNRELLGLLPVALATLFKFYTLPLIIIMFIFTTKKSYKIIYFLSFIILSIIIYRDIKLSGSNIPSGTFLTFGLSSILKWSNLYLSKIGTFEINNTAGMLALFVSFILLVSFLYAKIKHLDLFSLRGQPFYVFSIFYSVYLTCYLTGSSFDYRLFYLSVSAWVLIIFAKESKKLVNFSSLVIFLATWCGTQFWINNSSLQNINVLIQSVSDLFLFAVSAFGTAIYLRLIVKFLKPDTSEL
jgi:hypothetical protein